MGVLGRGGTEDEGGKGNNCVRTLLEHVEREGWTQQQGRDDSSRTSGRSQRMSPSAVGW